MTLVEWLTERRYNCLRIASEKTRSANGNADRAGWEEDAEYFRRAIEAPKRLASYASNANLILEMKPANRPWTMKQIEAALRLITDLAAERK